ncbi:NUDIX hydrolase domain-like protein [Chlamydoabsidia padenii]|nr:NUDIX hydrolase domain-like protein [Chlamydoabsidia padenii]
MHNLFFFFLALYLSLSLSPFFIRTMDQEYEGSVSTVDIHAILKTNNGPQIVLVVQYRPAIENYAVEFPSGLVDPNETPLDAACRELREETGYKVDKSDFRLSTRSVCYEPGLTNSTCYVAHATINTTSTTTHPSPELEQDEWSLQTILLPVNNLMTHLTDLQDRHNLIIDSRVYSFASGLDLASIL